MMAAGAERVDIVDQVCGLAAGQPAHGVRHQREKVALATQACADWLFSPALVSGVTPGERLLLAFDTCLAAGVQDLAAYYLKRLQQCADEPAFAAAISGTADPAAGNPRLAAMLGFARALVIRPAQANRQSLLDLAGAGLSTQDLVLLGQLSGFLAYQLRLVACLRALAALPQGQGALPNGAAPARPVADDPSFVHPANLPPPGEPLRLNGYTSETLGWQAWLPVVDPATADAEQQSVLDVSHPKARSSDFYLLLAHHPRVLLERSQAFNAIMYAPGGLSRADREIAATAVSRVNGCVYCASVHAQRFEQLTGRNDVMAQMFADPHGAGTNLQERAIIAASIALTRAPGQFGAAQLLPMRAAGLSDLQMLDAMHDAALFGWANLLMLNFAEAVFP